MLETRKRFTVRGLTHSATHHLLAAGESIEQRGYARVADIARLLDITRGSVSVAMQSLKAAGYVEQDDSHFFTLTEKGNIAIASVRARHEIVEQFLAEVLGLSAERSHRESCRLEYLIEPPTAKRLSALLKFWRENQDGPLEDEVDNECPDCGSQFDPQCPSCGLETLGSSYPLNNADDSKEAK